MHCMKKYFLFGSIVIFALILSGCSHISSDESKEEKEVAPNDGEAPPISTLVLEEPFKIGFMGPLTGNEARYGESIKRGVELAKKEARIKNLEVIYEDSKCDGKEAVNAINKLISSDKVSVIIGEVCSGVTLAVAPIAEQQKVVMISPASTSSKMSEFPYLFRTVPSDALQGVFGAKFVYGRKYRKLAILYSNEEYGIGLEKVLKKKFTELGGEVVSSEAVERGATDIRPNIIKIKTATPQVVYVILNSPATAIAALRQIKELEVNAVVIGSERLNNREVLEGAGDSAEGLIVTAVSSGTREFGMRYEKEYGAKPGIFSAQGYDAFIAVVRALETGARSGDEIQKALVNISFTGATGTIDFDEWGDISGNYSTLIVKDASFVPFAGKEAETPEPTEIPGTPASAQ